MPQGLWTILCCGAGQSDIARQNGHSAANCFNYLYIVHWDTEDEAGSVNEGESDGGRRKTFPEPITIRRNIVRACVSATLNLGGRESHELSL